MKEIVIMFFVFSSVIGLCQIGLFLSRITYRWTAAVDELLKQRKERKNKHKDL